MFLKTEKLKMPRLNFPVRWQAVLYRNYGMVADDKLAQVLGTDTATVRAEAAILYFPMPSHSARLFAG